MNVIAFCFLFYFSEPSSYRMAIEHAIEITEGGSVNRAIELCKVWRDKVLLKNKHILKVEMLLEKKREKQYLLLVIYHYKDRESARLAAETMDPLIEKAWPNETQRQAFFKELQSYMVLDEKVIHRLDVIH